MNKFISSISKIASAELCSAKIDTIQINVGLKCNLTCNHCHLESGPDRDEVMTRATMDLIIEKTKGRKGLTYDITGGSPETNPDLLYLVTKLRYQAKNIIVRTNLAVLDKDDYMYIPQFYADKKVELYASLPCYLEENVDAQRGQGVYEASIRSLKRLNEMGYGTTLPLTLVYNPGGPVLAPCKDALEDAYKKELADKWGIKFTRLITLNNMPLGRFLKTLESENKAEEYLALLTASLNPQTLDGLMCRGQINIGWDGRLYDCDFNQAVGLGVDDRLPAHIRDFSWDAFENRPITTADHCLGCTAGSGSSCQGSLA